MKTAPPFTQNTPLRGDGHTPRRARGTKKTTPRVTNGGGGGHILLVSLVKAALVALFFMHLRFEKVVPLWIVAVFPFFLIGLATLLVFIGTALG